MSAHEELAQRRADRLRKVAEWNARRDRKYSETEYLLSVIDFWRVAQNLEDGPSFQIWLENLLEKDKGLTVRYMNHYSDQFSGDNIAAYNHTLSAYGMDKYRIG